MASLLSVSDGRATRAEQVRERRYSRKNPFRYHPVKRSRAPVLKVDLPLEADVLDSSGKFSAPEYDQAVLLGRIFPSDLAEVFPRSS